MAKSKKNKKKTKKNSNYKNEVIEKNIPKKSEKNLKELERKAKLKEKQKKKDEKAFAKKQKALEKLRKKEEKKNLKTKEKEEKAAQKAESEKSEVKKEEVSKETPVKKEIPEVIKEVHVQPEINEEPVTENLNETEETSVEEVTEEVAETVEETVEETTEDIPETVEESEAAEELPEEKTEDEPAIIIEEVTVEMAEEIQPEEIPEEDTNIVLEEVTKEPEEKPEAVTEEKKKINLPKIDLKKIKFTKKNIIIAAVVVVTLAALIAVLSVIGIGETDYSPAIYSGRNFEDSEVSVIAISDEQQAQFIKDTNAKGNTRKFSFYANTGMNVTAPDSLLPVTIANPTTSEQVLLCTIVNDEGVIVYRSLGIVPGRFVNNVRLSQYLDYGKNELTLYVSAFEASEPNKELTYKKVGMQKVKLEVIVGNDYMSE